MIINKNGFLAVILVITSILMLTGCASTESNPEQSKTVSVSTVDELLAAIAPETEIILEPGIYNLTEASDYGTVHYSGYYTWNSYGLRDQYELHIKDADNLKFSGTEAEIVTEPRMANVLSFEKCEKLTLEGLKIGHTERAEQCECGVIRLSVCDDAALKACSLYGCGTVGIEAEDCMSLSVADTDIHHCSMTGISLTECRDADVDGCRMYECGTNEQYSEACSIFSLIESTGISIQDTEIYNNYTDALVLSQGQNEAAFKSLNIHGNRISGCFQFWEEASVQFENLSFADNSIDSWFNRYAEVQTATVDEEKLDETGLNERWGTQLSSSGMGTVEVAPAVVDFSGTEEIHVNSVDEFLAAIGSNVNIVIDSEELNLTEAMDYGEEEHPEYEDAPSFNGKSYAWMKVYDGFQLCIGNVSNFHITGGHIVTEPRYADVLAFYACSDISLNHVTAGHTLQGECCGGVIFLKQCENIIVQESDLYGCGILGLTAYDVSSLQVQNTLIHDCTYGAAQLNDSEDVAFLNCSIQNCPEPHFSLQNCLNFSWDGKLMNPYSSFSFE